MKRVQDELPFLKVLVFSARKEFENYIKAASRNKILALTEIVLNVLNRNIESTKGEILALRRYRRTLRKVSRLKISIKERKRIIVSHPRLFQQLLKRYLVKIEPFLKE